MINKKRKSLYLAMMVGVSTASIAQQNDTPGAIDDGGAIVLEEIIVTARKRQELIQSAPIAVTAITNQTIDDFGLNNIDDLANLVPGLSFSQAFGRHQDRPVIRGAASILAQIQTGVESGVAYYLDGVFFSGSLQTLDMNSIERVEVVKGPQSALYGRNSYAGAINFVTKSASSQEASYQLRGGVAEHDQTEASFSASVPLIKDVLGVRFSAQYYDYGGEYLNTVTPDAGNAGQENSRNFSLGLNYSPSENFDLRLSTIFSEDDDSTRALTVLGSSANNCFPGLRSNLNYRDASDNNPNQFFCGEVPTPNTVNRAVGGLYPSFPIDGIQRERTFTSFSANWNMGGSGYALAVNGGYLDEKRESGADLTFQNRPIFFSPRFASASAFKNSSRKDTEEQSFEVRLSSPTDRAVSWLVGAFFYEQELFDERIRTEDGQLVRVIDDGLSTIENNAIFASLGFRLSDNVSLTGEVRRAEDTKEDFSPELETPGRVVNEDTTYRVTADWQINASHLLYANHAVGVKPGGLNGDLGLEIGEPEFKTESNSTFELGLKSTWMEGRLQSAVTAFYSELEDLQNTQPAFRPPQSVNSIVGNSGNSEVLGIELEMQAAVSNNLQIGVNYAYTDAEYTSGCNATLYQATSGGYALGVWDPSFTGVTGPATPIFADVNRPVSTAGIDRGGRCNVDGNQVAMTPEHQFGIRAEWRAPSNLFNDAEYFIRGLYSFESSKFAQVQNLYESGEAQLLSARIGIEKGNWQLAFWGKNLLEEDSTPLPSSWFDVAAGPVNPGTGCEDDDANCSFLGPRTPFFPLRKGRQFGVNFSYDF